MVTTFYLFCFEYKFAGKPGPKAIRADQLMPTEVFLATGQSQIPGTAEVGWGRASPGCGDL